MKKEGKRMGRPPIKEGLKRRNVGISLDDDELEALREVAQITGESQGIACGVAIVERRNRLKKAKRSTK